MINLKLITQVVLFVGAICNSGFGLYNLAHNQIIFGIVQIISGILLMVVFTLLLLRQK